MSLDGKLEELGLGEILQIISLSRKSGTLSLRSGEREAVIVFHGGQVVRASSSMFPQSLGELLIRHAVIDPVVLRRALALQQSEGFLERLGTILVKHFGVTGEVIEEVVRNQVERVVLSLFEWSEGSFDFQIQDLADCGYDTRMDPLQFMLDQGLNPQYLAMEGSRVMEERRRAEEAPPGDRERTARPGTGRGVARPALPVPLVIVDDDPPTLQALAGAMEARDFEVFAQRRSEDALVTIDCLVKRGKRPLILIDLIMPRMDGSGVLGGIELVELLQHNFRDLPMMVMSDYHYADAEARVLELGCPFIMKPRRAEIGTTDWLDGCARRIEDELGRRAEAPERFDLGEALRLEMDDHQGSIPPPPEGGEITPTLLKGLLDELNNPDNQGEVLLLVLRFASEFLNRAALFAVEDLVVSGVGQFGISDGTLSGDDKVRAITFPLQAGSMFSEPARSGRPVTCKPELTPVDSHIFKQLGGGVPNQVFIGPIFGASRLIAFLYGDNLPEDTPLQATDTLARFLSRAGLAMERGLRSRQSGNRERRPP